jgi:hypothetical protein
VSKPFTIPCPQVGCETRYPRELCKMCGGAGVVSVVTADEYDKVAAERDRLRAACEASLAMIQDIKMVSWKAASIRTGSPAIIAERLIRAALALGTTDPAK